MPQEQVYCSTLLQAELSTNSWEPDGASRQCQPFPAAEEPLPFPVQSWNFPSGMFQAARGVAGLAGCHPVSHRPGGTRPGAKLRWHLQLIKAQRGKGKSHVMLWVRGKGRALRIREELPFRQREEQWCVSHHSHLISGPNSHHCSAPGALGMLYLAQQLPWQLLRDAL